uniref:Kinesin-associated protein 3a n=1 Tax=Neogobius melanostomus TaxID=47308 RepID=A0A8C6S309_9GOBI
GRTDNAERVKSCSLDVHLTLNALVLSYELEATVLGEQGGAMLGERSCRKLIHVKNLSEDSDVGAVACKVLEQVPLIPESKLSEVQHLLLYLKKSSLHWSSSDQYVELLYEDLQDKLRGASLLLQLCLNKDHLQELQHNEAGLRALARVLREDSKHSIQLSINILSVFHCFSRFSQFHSVVSQFEVGALCVTLMEQELNKVLGFETCSFLHPVAHADSPQDLDLQKDLQKSQRKFHSLVQKQNHFFTVAVSLLLNLSEDLSVGIEMCQKNIVPMLVRFLDREDPQLLQASVHLLKNLSIFVENKDTMVRKLVPLVQVKTDLLLLDFSLKLLLNLSFDTEARSHMVQSGLIPRLSALLGENHTDNLCLCAPEQHTLPLLVGGHLTYSCSCVKGAGLQMLLSRAVKGRQVLLMKIVRNLSQHQETTPVLKPLGLVSAPGAHGEPSVPDLRAAGRGLRAGGPGTVSNLRLLDIDWETVLDDFTDLMPFLLKRLSPYAAEDLALEVVLMVGTLAADQGCAATLSHSGVIPALVHLLKDQQLDDEFVYQIVFVFSHMMFHKETRNALIQEPRILPSDFAQSCVLKRGEPKQISLITYRSIYSTGSEHPDILYK